MVRPARGDESCWRVTGRRRNDGFLYSPTVSAPTENEARIKASRLGIVDIVSTTWLHDSKDAGHHDKVMIAVLLEMRDAHPFPPSGRRGYIVRSGVDRRRG